MLLTENRVKLPEENFPCRWQTVIFRNYGFVSLDKIARVLGCDEDVVLLEAKRLGLSSVVFDENWEKSGYMTIIRNNWYLLPYDQLLELLGFTSQRLEFVLQNEDFLGVKLGGFKPSCERVEYFPLTKEQEKQTEEIYKIVSGYSLEEKAFGFFEDYSGDGGEAKPFDRGTIMVHGYLTPCGDVFLEDDEKYMPDGLLSEYSKKGINAVWVHGLLSALSYYPFDESLCVDYKKRRYKLINLIKRCKKYGIKVYLYLNEPRGLPVEKLGKFSHLAGRVEGGIANLCIENKEVQEYLYTAVKDLFDEVSDIGGVFTITMSENPTHCHYVQGNNCPRCKHLPPEEVTAKINNIIYNAVKDSNSSAEVIANLWGWSQFMGWNDEQAKRGIGLLKKGISVLCVSEFDLDIEKGGVKGKIIDYSISNPGPGEVAKTNLTLAKELGHKTYAKIQVNNSWECSAVPYLPVFDLTYEHLENLKRIGVEDYLLTWTLGGYPSPAMDMISDYSTLKERFSLDGWYEKYYGENGKIVKDAVEEFCLAFREYPFSVQTLYLSPQTLGASNLWDLEASQNKSTMVCYAFDDYESWLGQYPYEVYLAQYKKLLSGWNKGIDKLKKIPNNQLIDELLLFAEVAYCHFEANLAQTEYAKAKRDGDRPALEKAVSIAYLNAERMISLKAKSSLIGFETSNHYFYTLRGLVEKVINLKRIERQLNKI